MTFYLKSPGASSRHNRFGISQCHCEAIADVAGILSDGQAHITGGYSFLCPETHRSCGEFTFAHSGIILCCYSILFSSKECGKITKTIGGMKLIACILQKLCYNKIGCYINLVDITIDLHTTAKEGFKC